MSLRSLTPLGWLMAGLAVLVLIGAIAWSWNNLWSWLPWSDEQRAERAETRAEAAESDAAARTLESAGNAAQVARTEAYGDIRIRVETDAATSVTQARSAPDATDPLSSERAARLADHDRGLCRNAPALCTPASAGPP